MAHRLSPLTLLLLLALTACGGSSSPAIIPVTIEVAAPAVPAGEGWLLDGVAHPNAVNMVMGDSSSDLPIIGMLTFDLTGIGAVQDAQLTIHQGVSTNAPFSLGPLLVDHIDGGGALDPADEAGGTLTAAAFALADEASWTLDVTPYLQADVAAGRATTSFRFRFANETNADGIEDEGRITASTNADVASRPTLIIQHFAP